MKKMASFKRLKESPSKYSGNMEKQTKTTEASDTQYWNLNFYTEQNHLNICPPFNLE
jgi:hypothetical protein